MTPTLAVIDTDRDLAGSLQELVTLSDIIAIGLLTGEPRVHGASSDGFIEHLAQPFRVDRAIRGSVQVGTSIEVIRSVRASDGVPFVDEGAQPLEVGKSYLLFLRSAKDVYVTTSGPQGQFAIVDDRVCSLKPQP